MRENVRKCCLPVVSSKLVESHSTPSVDRTSPLCCHAWLPFPIWCSTKNLTKDLFCSAITTNLYLRGKRLLVLKTPSSISYLGIWKSSPNSTSLRAVSSRNSRIVIGNNRSAESFVREYAKAEKLCCAWFAVIKLCLWIVFFISVTTEPVFHRKWVLLSVQLRR